MTEASMETLRNEIVALGITNAVIGDLPSLELDCVAISPRTGYPNTYYFGSPTTGEPLLVVVVRNKDYQIGQDWYNKIQKKLDKYSNESVGILSSILTGSPGYLGRDSTGFNEWNMIFHISLVE